MVFTKNKFYLLLAVIVISPFLAGKMWWLMHSDKTIGEFRFIGHGNLGSALGISSYPVIRFMIGRDTIYFNGNVNLDGKTGEKIYIRYQKDNPQDACVDSFVCLWMETIAYALMPVLVLLVLYVMPDRLDPVIPKNAKVVIGKKQFFRIIK
ncbi:MAG: hypothetical protein JST75_17095 [Bacteroidetes bacterium]|nr:hypothetical protein [Bacteroidota bacterium]